MENLAVQIRKQKKSRRESQCSQSTRHRSFGRFLGFESLEDRRLLSIDLLYSGTAAPYSLILSSTGAGNTMVVDGNYNVTPGAEKILIGLGGATFHSGTANGHLAYKAGADGSGATVPATSAKSVIVDVSSAARLGTLWIGGDAIQAQGPVTADSTIFNAPVTLTGDLALSGNDVTFPYAVTGNHDIRIGSGTDNLAATFSALGGTGTAAIGDGVGPAITVKGTANVNFSDTVQTQSGIDQEDGSWITFSNTVTIGHTGVGSVASTFDGEVSVTPVMALDTVSFNSDDAVTFGNSSSDNLTVFYGDLSVIAVGALTVHSNISANVIDADFETGAGINGFDVALSGCTVSVGAITTSGSAAGGVFDHYNMADPLNPVPVYTYPNKVGGKAGTITLTATDATTPLITLNGNLTAQGGAGQGTGSGGAGGAVTANDSVVLGANVTISTIPGAGSTPASGGAVWFKSTVSGANGLTVDAGTAGSVDFDGAVGAVPLTALTVDGLNVAIDSTLAVAGTVDIDAAGTVDFGGAVTTTTTGLVTITNVGVLTIVDAADFSLTGAFLQDGAGAVSTAGDIVTTADAVTFTGPVTLTGPVAMDTAGGNIRFTSTVNSDAALTTRDLTPDILTYP